MKVSSILVSSAVLGLLVAGDAAAQKLSLRIDKGLVTLDADNVTVDEVLARWVDTTGLNLISKSGQGSDIPVSLRLEGVPEGQALAMVLRDLSGYIMGERRDPLTGIVTIDRLMILPQSAAQPNAGPAVAPRRPFTPSRVATELTPPQPVQVVDETPVELAPAPNGAPAAPGAAGSFSLGTGDGADTAATLQILDEQIRALRPETPAPSATPGNPFGTSQGAARPGEMTPAPAPPPAEFIPPITNPDADPRAIRERIIESQPKPAPEP
jgi:hypothetical protein